EKRYLAIIIGKMSPPEGKLEGFLLKDEVKKQVTVYHKPVPGAKTAATRYKTLSTKDGLSLVECELLTGRTHQIRAQFADAGCPLLGDGKYGREKSNREYGRSGQALYSYQLTFTFPTDAGILSNMKGRTFTVEKVDFVTEYFGESRAHS
ncbi:MAG: RNA pseudouridine synthase, partial [Pseudoflavonifractor sp.]